MTTLDTFRRIQTAIRKSRQETGLTQMDLAVKSGVSLTTITRFENGKLGSQPRLDVLLSVLDVLGLDLDVIPKAPDTSPQAVEDLDPVQRQLREMQAQLAALMAQSRGPKKRGAGAGA